MPATRDVGRRAPAPRRRPIEPYVLPAGPRGDVGTGSGYPGVPKPPLASGRGTGRNYVLPIGAPRGDAGHSLSPAESRAVDAAVKTSRIQELRKRTAASPRGLSHLADQLKAAVIATQYVPSTGGGPGFVRGGTALSGSRFSPPAATALAPTLLPVKSNSFTKALTSDAFSLGTGPFVAAYQLGAGSYEAAAHGDTSRLSRLAKGVGSGVSHSAPGELLIHGSPGKALKAVETHPLLSALDFAGAESVLGRTAGAVTRGVGKAGAEGVRGSLAAAGSTVRAPTALTLDPASAAAGAVRQRSLSKDLIRSTAQRALDSKRTKLTDSQGNVVTTVDRGKTVPVIKPSMREMQRQGRREADVVASRANSVERMVRDIASRQFHIRGVKGKAARDIVSMVVEGTITSAEHFKNDLIDHRVRLEAALKDPELHRHKEEVAATQARLALVNKVLFSPKAMAQKEAIVKAGEDIGRTLNEGERQLIQARMLDPKAAARSKLVPVAVEHLGGRHFTVEEHQALERQAMAKEQAAIDALRGVKDGKFGRLPDAGEKLRLERAVRDARAERYAVSGRHPEQLAAHEAAQVAHQTAKDAHSGALAAEAKARTRVAELGHSHRSERGRAVMTEGPVASFHVGDRRFALKADAAEFARKSGGKVERVALSTAEADRVGAMSTARNVLAAATKRRQETAKALTEAGKAAKAARKPPIQAAIRTAEGRHLPNEKIHAFLSSRGRDPGTVAYLPHRLDVRGGRAFHTQFRPGTRPNFDSGETRTGSAYAKGVTESSAELIKDAGVRQATQLAKAQQIDKMIGERGQRMADGRYFTGPEAKEIADRLRKDRGEKLVPMRAFPAALDAESKRVIRENLQGPAGMEGLGQRLFNDRRIIDSSDKRARNVVLMPESIVNQLNKHLAPAGEVEKFFQFLNRPFRFAVLPQFRWLTGNVAEPYLIRLTGAGSGINVFGLGTDIARATLTLRRMERSPDPALRQAALELRAQHLGGLEIGGRGLSNRRTSEELPYGLGYAAVVRDLPVIRQGVDMMSAMPKAFFTFNRMIESGAQRAGIGLQLRRDVQEMTGSWTSTLRLQSKAFDEAAKGLVNTATQKRFVDSAHELLGKYEGWSPPMRRLVQSTMPFAPWALNAARFAFWTLPAHRSAQTALLLKVNDVVAKDWAAQHANVPPGSLKLAVPTANGGWIDLARYTPWGMSQAIVQGDDNQLLGFVAPQFSGAQAALRNTDPFGRTLQVDPSKHGGSTKAGTAQRRAIAANSLAEALVPYLAMARRFREGGSTAYGDSTVFSPRTKPNTKHSGAVSRVLNPIRPTFLGASSGPVTPLGRGGPGGLDPADLHDLRQAAGSAQGLDQIDLEELRALAAGK